MFSPNSEAQGFVVLGCGGFIIYHRGFQDYRGGDRLMTVVVVMMSGMDCGSDGGEVVGKEELWWW